MSDEIRSMPLRLDLPSELAALAIPLQEDEEAVVILNSNEKDLRGTYIDFRLGVLLPLLWGWIVGHTRWIRQHQVITSLVAATSGAVLATGLPAVFKKEEPHEVGSQPTVTIMVTPHPAPISPGRPSSQSTRSPRTPRPREASQAEAPPPPPEHKAPHHPSTPPASPAHTRRTPAPTHENTAPTGGPTTSSAQPHRTEAPPGPSPTNSAEPQEPPAPGEPATPAPTRDCSLRVDLDPLLDLCVLS